MNHTQTHAQDIQDMMAAVYGLADLLEQSCSNEGSEDETQVIGRFHRGCVVTAIKHLANHASSLTDIIQEQETRKAAGAGGDA
ncbi:hypothetical protein [Vreelandella nigrificans]|uniref:Uncharacterized protein n=1 Tax=Vreelandella nigrificans TaxID=2042704 RepID=A0A2A4HUB2_9GAMM|nr:hypothetical protein [Halomonas nigrificans]PCF97661.1 hypothetical protein CPA45_02750 [Halomonas nigrificans]